MSDKCEIVRRSKRTIAVRRWNASTKMMEELLFYSPTIKIPKVKLINENNEQQFTRPQRTTNVRRVHAPSDTSPPKRNKKKIRLDSKAAATSVFKNITIENLSSCFVCSTDASVNESIECPICSSAVHKKCLLINEPFWKFKSPQFRWFCKTCRRDYCNRCCGNKSLQEFHCCLNCNVGQHTTCYKPDEDKPLNISSTGMYICKPCKIFAFLGDPINEHNHVQLSHDNTVPLMKVRPFEQIWDVPDITDWDSFQVFAYLKKRDLPVEVTDMIVEKDLDGKAIQALEREHIVMNMGLKLGPALRLYKEVRILQTKNTSFKVYWEDNLHLNGLE